MIKRTNDDWVEEIRAGGERQSVALEDLKSIISRWLPLTIEEKLGKQSEATAALAEEIVQETLIKVIENLDTFEGRSLFTTWAQKIAVRAALTELRKARWREIPLPTGEMDSEDEPEIREIPDDREDPVEWVTRKDMMERVNRIIKEEITEKQRQVLGAVMEGFSLEEAAHHLNTNRNALYKMLHDARLRLKKRLEKEGLTPQDVLAVFESKKR